MRDSARKTGKETCLLDCPYSGSYIRIIYQVLLSHITSYNITLVLLLLLLGLLQGSAHSLRKDGLGWDKLSLYPRRGFQNAPPPPHPLIFTMIAIK